MKAKWMQAVRISFNETQSIICHPSITQLERHYRYVEVRYEGGESGKVGHSLREHGGLRKEHWYVADQSVYKNGLRVRTKGQRQEERKEFRERGDPDSLLGQADWAAGYKMHHRMRPKRRVQLAVETRTTNGGVESGR